ncbi:MAG: pseudouridine synthase [Limosilactobacillus sp.]
MIRWHLTETLPAGQASCSLRELLHRQWLLPDRLIHYLRRRQHVLVNGRYQPVNEPVAPGDRVDLLFNGDEVRTPAANHYRLTADPHLAVLFENRDLLVVNKPRGQKSHPNLAGETGTVMNDVAGYLAGSNDGAYMVHRLDLQTSGAMIVAKNPTVVPVLNRLIADGQIHREYVAVVEGRLEGTGCWNWPIGRNPADPRWRAVDGLHAQPARTYYRSLAANDQRSLVRLRLATGRTHQLRVHLAYSGHPIVGDPIYNQASDEQMLLHGECQRLVIPFTFQKRKIVAPLPTYFQKYLVKYKLS